MKRFEEFITENKEETLKEPLKSFELKQELSDKVWDKENDTYVLKEDIRQRLIEISDDAWEELIEDLGVDIEYDEVMLTGSLSNFNWSKYSDFDLHIMVDYSKLHDDTDLMLDYLDKFKKLWNFKHDITIEGFEVEIYVQDVNAEHVSTGYYYLIANEWGVEPQPFDEEVDFETLEKKAELYIDMIDEIEEKKSELDYDELTAEVKKIWKKIKKGRQEGLEEGELGVGNLVFKLLRRNGYIEKVVNLMSEAYDKKMSM